MALPPEITLKKLAIQRRKPVQSALAGLPAMLALLAAPAFANSHFSGDPAAGAVTFAQQCVSCHVVVNGAGETLAGRSGRIGPNLFGIVGQTVGTVEGFRYADAIVAAGQAGALWDEANFTAYVADPTGWLRVTLDDPQARSRMSFQVRDQADALNLYAFLASIGPSPETEDSSAAVTQEPAEVTIGGRPVSYAADQAERGEDRYERDCADCHGHDLKGGMNGGASLRSVNFLQKYGEGAPVSDLFYYLSTAMPPSSPGRYSPAVYADLTAYILRRNGFQAGAPLPSDLDLLDNLFMEK